MRLEGPVTKDRELIYDIGMHTCSPQLQTWSICVAMRTGLAHENLTPRLLLTLTPLLACVFMLVIASAVSAQTSAPVLVSDPASTRAIALESPMKISESFRPSSLIAWGADKRTRVMLFALNLDPTTNESAVTAEAEDAAHTHYTLTVDCVRQVPNVDGLSLIIVALNDNIPADVGDVLIGITVNSAKSNRVRIGIGHVGGGPADDAGAKPTPLPPIIISGRITLQGSGLGNLLVALGGSEQATSTTDANGSFSFTLKTTGGYAITPSAAFYTFAPSSKTFTSVTGNRTANFEASPVLFSITGTLRDEGAHPLDGVTVKLDNSTSVVTDAAGNYSFPNLRTGNYTVTPSDTNIFSFTPRTVTPLVANERLDFQATRKTYIVNGKVTGGSLPLNNVVLTLMSTNGMVYKVFETGTDGAYSFTDVPAGYSYQITPYDNVFHRFMKPALQQKLDSDQTIDITGTLRTYSIRGTILDQAAAPLGGTTVTLHKATSISATTVTDADGNYSFSNLCAGCDYSVGVAKIKYIFTPASQQFGYLSADRRADFAATLTYDITGRITDDSELPLMGFTMTLTGPQTQTTLTDFNGNYSFTVSRPGNYTLTPSKEQNFYSFTPVSQTVNVAGDLSLTFAVSFLSLASPSYVLEFNGAQQAVYYGPFWSSDVDLGHFFWEFWAMPGENNFDKYLLSDGHGGAHALLFGFSHQDDPKRYSLSGNIFDGSNVISFYSAEGPAPGEWGHIAVGWDGRNIITYYDGVPVGKAAFAGPRRSPPPTWGGGPLYIGGSNHSNFIGRIAQVRGFEGSNPREGAAEASFAPQTLFSREGNLLTYFFRLDSRVADLTSGYDRVQHTGQLFGTPQFVLDPTAPDFTNANNPGQVSSPLPAPPAPPASSLVFDSFSRKNSTYILGGVGGLGATEGGSRGPLAWKTNEPDATKRQPFGILSGRAVLLADADCVAWVDAGSSNIKILSSRTRGNASAGYNAGIAFRVADAQNYFFAYTEGENGNTLNVGYYVAGTIFTVKMNVAMPDGWWDLAVITSAAGDIEVYADSTLVYATTNTVMSQNTAAGIFNKGAGMALTNRWETFAVTAIP